MSGKYKQYAFTVFFNTPKFDSDLAEKVLDFIIAFVACLGFELNLDYTCGFSSEEVDRSEYITDRTEAMAEAGYSQDEINEVLAVHISDDLPHPVNCDFHQEV